MSSPLSLFVYLYARRLCRASTAYNSFPGSGGADLGCGRLRRCVCVCVCAAEVACDGGGQAVACDGG
jgi:hypothetical protein